MQTIKEIITWYLTEENDETRFFDMEEDIEMLTNKLMKSREVGLVITEEMWIEYFEAVMNLIDLSNEKVFPNAFTKLSEGVLDDPN